MNIWKNNLKIIVLAVLVLCAPGLVAQVYSKEANTPTTHVAQSSTNKGKGHKHVATYYPQLLESRILKDSDRSDQSGSANADVTNWIKTSLAIIACQIGYNGKDTVSSSFKLQWRNETDNPGGSFSDFYQSSGELRTAESPHSDTISHGAFITSTMDRCTNKDSTMTWQNGIESLSCTSGAIDLGDDYYSELQFAIDLNFAHDGDQYTFQLYNATSGSATGTCGAQITIAPARPTVALNTADAYAFSTSTPTLEFTGTDPGTDSLRYQIQITDLNYFAPDCVGWSHHGTTHSDDYPATTSANKGAGHTFLSVGSTQLTGVIFYVAMMNNPTGNMYAYLYAKNSGSDIPTGSALATSDAVDVSILSSSYFRPVKFTFSTPYTLTKGTYYVVTLEWTGQTTNQQVEIGRTQAGLGYVHSRSYCYYNGGTWYASSDYDLLFKIDQTVGFNVDKTSGTDVGFLNTIDNPDTDPFTETQKISYTVQSALSAGTYYWRVRAIDPGGGNIWGDWSSSQSFTISSTSISKVGEVTYSSAASVAGLAKASISKISDLQ